MMNLFEFKVVIMNNFRFALPKRESKIICAKIKGGFEDGETD